MPFFGQLGYIGLTAFALNLVVTVLLTGAMRAAKLPEGEDRTTAEDYRADAGDPKVHAIPELSER